MTFTMRLRIIIILINVKKIIREKMTKKKTEKLTKIYKYFMSVTVTLKH